MDETAVKTNDAGRTLEGPVVVDLLLVVILGVLLSGTPLGWACAGWHCSIPLSVACCMVDTA